jgi:hypothetical protein
LDDIGDGVLTGSGRSADARARLRIYPTLPAARVFRGRPRAPAAVDPVGAGEASRRRASLTTPRLAGAYTVRPVQAADHLIEDPSLPAPDDL